jgi:hypothetical protein
VDNLKWKLVAVGKTGYFVGTAALKTAKNAADKQPYEGILTWQN